MCVWGGGGVRWMAMGKCHSLNILSGSLPTLPLSSSVLHSPHVSPPSISLPHSLYRPLLPSLCCLLREAASVCFSLSRFLIRRQWKSPLNRCRRKGGRGTGRTIRGEFIRVAQSVITPVPLSLPPATTSLPCHRATDYSPLPIRTHTHTHTDHLWVFLRMSVGQLCWCALP